MSELFQRNADICAVAHDDSTLLLNIDTGKYHGLNAVSTRIWELLEHPISQDALVASLLQEFDVTPEACRRDVSTFLDGLRQRGLLITG